MNNFLIRNVLDSHIPISLKAGVIYLLKILIARILLRDATLRGSEEWPICVIKYVMNDYSRSSKFDLAHLSISSYSTYYSYSSLVCLAVFL